MQPLSLVLGAETADGIVGHRGRRRNLGQGPTIRPPEPKRAVGLPLDMIALLVDRSMVPATQQSEVRERGRAALRPVADVMPLAEPQSTPREAAALVPLVQRAPQRRRNRASPGADLGDATVLVVPHDDAARVAGEAPRRFRGNVRAVLEDGLTRLIRVRQRQCIDVDHHLIPLARRAGIDPVVQRRLRQHSQGVGPLLGRARGIGGRVSRIGASSAFLVERLARGVERAHEQRAHLGR